MKFVIDRNLPLPLRNQLHGLIEYGISCGELAPGEILPSVRELADMVGVAPMTVAQVYADLKEKGLLQTRPGSGTFVADRQVGSTTDPTKHVYLYRQIDNLIEQSRKLGLQPSELIAAINTRLRQSDHGPARPRILVVGLFPDATRSYAAFLADRLADHAHVEFTTISALEQDTQGVPEARSADLVVTIVNRLQQVKTLLPDANVVAIRFTPSEETRRALASLDSRTKVAAVSLFPEFLPILKSGIERFAPHVSHITSGTMDMPAFRAELAEADVIIHATGADETLKDSHPQLPRIEYRHAPDEADIERIIIPALPS